VGLGVKKSLAPGDMLTRRPAPRHLELLQRQTNSAAKPETLMQARIGEMFDAIITAAMGLASMSAVFAIVMGA
jgi:hypothetical protein